MDEEFNINPSAPTFPLIKKYNTADEALCTSGESHHSHGKIRRSIFNSSLILIIDDWMSALRS